MIVSVPRLFGKIVSETSAKIHVPLNFIFGDASYIREQIVTMKSAGLSNDNFPLIGLYWSSSNEIEANPSRGILLSAVIRFIVATSSSRDSNENRMESVYESELYPILDSLISELSSCHLFDFGNDGKVKFRYSEGYDAPFLGLVDNTGKDLAEIVDCISVSNLTLSIRNEECKLREFLRKE